jgi:Fe-S cluster biogenesis protein NfuA
MDTYTQIQNVLEEIRPTLEQDGGGVEIESFENGDLTLHLLGACAGCPMSSVTFGMIVENRLREVCSDKIHNIYYTQDRTVQEYQISK